MGACASTSKLGAGDVQHEAAVKEVLQALETLRREASSPVQLPIKTHDARLPSSDRGVSLAFLDAVRIFYRRHGGLKLSMGDVCKGDGKHVTVCKLTLSTGLSLAESVAHVAERDKLEHARRAVSRARGFFSYSWTGTELADMLVAIEDVVRPLEAESGQRHVWVDMFCASQNLLAGVYRDEGITKESDLAAYLARKEDTDRIFDDALEVVSEVYFYCSPLVGKWNALDDPFLSPQREARGAPPQPWVRRGAAAITRAWCLFELSFALGKECKLHVALSRADRNTFVRMLTRDFDEIAGIVASIDARDAQITKVEDRPYILSRVKSLAPGEADAEGQGLSCVTARVSEALRGWLVASAKEELAKLGPAKRGTSILLMSVARLLQRQGELDGAEELLREALDARRETLGNRHPSTLCSINNLGSLLFDKGELDGAEELYREDLDASRETLGNRHPSTLTSINNLGLLLKDKGELDGAEELYREALHASRETLGNRHPSTLVSIANLGGLLRDKGELDGAEELLREALEAKRETLGNRHPSTLCSINNLGSLLQDNGELDGAEELYREALDAFRETLGNRHPDTLCSIANLGLLLKDKGELDGAEELLREALDASRETLGNRHPDTLGSINNLGSLLQDKGELDGAEELLREALDARREMLGNRHLSTLTSIGNYADLLREKGDPGAARVEMGDAPGVAREILGADHALTLASEAKAARIGIALGGASADALRDVVARMREALGLKHPLTQKYENVLSAM